MKQLNVGIIGAGRIAEKMATTINKMNELKAYAIASRDIAKAKDFANIHNVCKAYGSYEQALTDDNIDFDKHIAKKVTTRFSDVAGMKNVKQEVEEVIDFIKNPSKYLIK